MSQKSAIIMLSNWIYQKSKEIMPRASHTKATSIIFFESVLLCFTDLHLTYISCDEMIEILLFSIINMQIEKIIGNIDP